MTPPRLCINLYYELIVIFHLQCDCNVLANPFVINKTNTIDFELLSFIIEREDIVVRLIFGPIFKVRCQDEMRWVLARRYA